MEIFCTNDDCKTYKILVGGFDQVKLKISLKKIMKKKKRIVHLKKIGKFKRKNGVPI